MRDIAKRLHARIRGLISRAVVTAVDNSTKNPRITVKDKSSTGKDVELFQIFGLTAMPEPASKPECMILSSSGSQDALVCLGLSGALRRPKDGKPGETILYSKLDADNPHRIHLKDDGSILAATGTDIYELSPGAFKVDIQGTKIEVTAGEIKFTVGSNTFTISSGGTVTTENVTADGVSVKTHTHTGVQSGASNTGLPN